jgi:FkbM family methyltransferase
MPALRHRAAHFLLKKLGMFDRSYRETVAGRTFTIPIVNGRKTYVTEPWMSEVLERLLALKPGAFIDVGVNLGQTLLKVAAIDPHRPYIGFEPNPACVDYAWKLIQKNGLNFTVVPAGIADTTTLVHLEMFREEDTDPSASIVPAFRSNVVARKRVMVVDPQSLPEGTIPNEVAVVKIDVEGGELIVLRGLLPLLRRTRPFLVVEVLPPSAADRVERQAELERHLGELHYRLFRIRRDDRDRLEAFDPIETLGIQTDLLSCDYVFAPAELAASVRN